MRQAAADAATTETTHRKKLNPLFSHTQKPLATVHRFLRRRKRSPIDGETQQDEAGGLHVASGRPRRLPPYLTLLKNP